MAEDDEGSERRRAFAAVSDGVIGAAVLLAAGVYGGSWFDSRFHTSPWFTIGLSMLGGILGLLRMVIKAIALDTNKNKSIAKTASSAQSLNKADNNNSSGNSKKQRLPYEDFNDE